MKKSNLIHAGVLGLIVLAAECVFATPTATTNTLVKILDSGATSTMTLLTADCWSDGLQPHADADYLIGMKGTIRLPEGAASYDFDGNSLQLGSTSVGVSLYQKPASLNFKNDGLYLCKGIWGSWAGNTSPTISGRVTVLSSQASPFKFTADNVNTGLRMAGPWFGDASAGVDCAVSATRSEHNYTLYLLGDLSAYYGRIHAYRTVSILLGETVFPGTLWMDNSSGAAHLAAWTNTTSVTLGNLTLAAGTIFEPKASLPTATEPATNSTFRVTGALSVTGPVWVRIPAGLDTLGQSPELRFPILTKAAAASGTLQLSDFAISNETTTVYRELYSLDVATDPVSGDTSLELVRKPMVVLERDTTTADKWPGDPNQQTNPGCLSTTNFWSDAQIPHAGTFYYTDGRVARSWYNNGGSIYRTNDVFAGEALVSDGSLVLQTPYTVISNLYFIKTAPKRYPVLANWHSNGDRTTNTFAAGGTKSLRANRLVLLNDTSFSYNSQGVVVRLDAPIEGSGKIVVAANGGNNRGAYHEFAGDNTKWTGCLSAEANSNDFRVAYNYTNTCEIMFRETCHLGGPLSAFNSKAIALNKKAVLHPLQTMTYDEPTRGIDIETLGGGIRTDAGTTFTLKSPLLLRGTMGKVGEGTLVLASPVSFNSTGVTSPGTKSYVIEVLEGGLRASATNAADGVSFTFGETGAIEADPEAVGDEATYGLYDVKVDAPFARASSGYVPVRLVLPTSYSSEPHPISATICTVNATAAASLGTGAFAVARPAHCRSYVTAKTNADGTVTYTATVAPSGMIFTIR